MVGEVWVKGVGGLQHGHACPSPLFQPASTPSPHWTIQAGGVHDKRPTTQEAPPCGQTQHGCDSGILLEENRAKVTGSGPAAVSVNNYKVKQQLAEITHNSTQAGSDPLKSDRPDTVHLSPLARAVPVTSPTCQTGRMTS